MAVTTNGPPKAGNHMLVKAVQLLGHPCEVAHWATAQREMVRGRHIFIKRDPRNLALSMLRWEHLPLTQGTYSTKLRDFESGVSLVERLAQFEGWLTDPATFVVRFEDMLTSDAQLRRIAEFLETPFLDDAFGALRGGTVTWTGRHSDYRELWSPEIDAAWAQIGGSALLERWGY